MSTSHPPTVNTPASHSSQTAPGYIWECSRRQKWARGCASRAAMMPQHSGALAELWPHFKRLWSLELFNCQNCVTTNQACYFFYQIRKSLECGMCSLGDLLMMMSQNEAMINYSIPTGHLNSILSKSSMGNYPQNIRCTSEWQWVMNASSYPRVIQIIISPKCFDVTWG